MRVALGVVAALVALYGALALTVLPVTAVANVAAYERSGYDDRLTVNCGSPLAPREPLSDGVTCADARRTTALGGAWFALLGGVPALALLLPRRRRVNAEGAPST